MKSSLPLVIILSACGLGLWLVLVQSTPHTVVATQPLQAAPHPVTTSPSPRPKPITPPVTDTTPEPTDPNLPPSVTLPVQFASQSPLGKWVLPYEEFCEETSSLISAHYALGIAMPARAKIDAELLKIKAYEEQTFGFYEDTTAEQTSHILTDYYGLTDVTVVTDPTENDIKKFLADGKAVMVPSAGQELGSPYYKAPGPIYHMLVLKGYTPDGYFITQDPGTNTKGENYKFEISTVMNAMHDWNADDIGLGGKVIIVVGKQK